MNCVRTIFTFFCVLTSIVLCAESKEEPPYQFQGVHFLASYSECDQDALSDVESLSQAMLSAVQECGATILNSSSWVFPPNGLTMVILLSESHASIHTYPEHKACFVDLFTCGEKCSAEKFDAALRAYLKPQAVSGRTMIRNQEIQEKSCSSKTDEMREDNSFPS